MEVFYSNCQCSSDPIPKSGVSSGGAVEEYTYDCNSLRPWLPARSMTSAECFPPDQHFSINLSEQRTSSGEQPLQVQWASRISLRCVCEGDLYISRMSLFLRTFDRLFRSCTHNTQPTLKCRPSQNSDINVSAFFPTQRLPSPPSTSSNIQSTSASGFFSASLVAS